jgi:branched-subunit amino acid aminotransferase/4-amino-4-deoxychorismate lyase
LHVHRICVSEPIAYLAGGFLPASAAKLSLADLGLQGMAVTETVRTFGHHLFRLDEHLDRLALSLELARIDFPSSLAEMRSIAEQLVEQNARLIAPTGDLGLTVFVTAGPNPTYLGGRPAELQAGPSLGMHTWPLPFERWAERLRTGQHLVTPAVRQLPRETLDPRVKSRSRLHWHLAGRQAQDFDPAAAALLLDANGCVTETATANFFIVTNGGILTPRTGTTLAGVSQRVVRELAAARGISYGEADLRPENVLAADEAFTSSTPYCLLPVCRFNGHLIGEGCPGTVYSELLAAWSARVGVDIAQQIRSHVS